MNKKGFIAEALVDFYSYVAFILILIIFFLLFSVQKCTGPSEQEMIGSFEENNAEIILLNYLRTPIKIDSQEMIMADLINLWVIDRQKYESKFVTQTKNSFKNIQGCFELRIPLYDNTINPINIKNTESTGSFPITGTKQPNVFRDYAEIQFPSLKGLIKIRLVISKECYE